MDQAKVFVERHVWRFLRSPPSDPFLDSSTDSLVTPLQVSRLHFDLPSDHSSSSSSASSLSSSSTFWISPGQTRRSVSQYIPMAVRNSVSKRQVALVLCIILALMFWVVPPPGTWHPRVVHVTLQQPLSNPYQVLQPIAKGVPEKQAPDPVRWLAQNGNDRFAESNSANLWSSVPVFGHMSEKPRAALISLVRNSELPGILQSMRQLEFQWNRKYGYPWVFFNDEPFSDEFKVT